MNSQYYHDPTPYRPRSPFRGRSPHTVSQRQHYSQPPVHSQHYSPTRHPRPRTPPRNYSPIINMVIFPSRFLKFSCHDERKLVKGLTGKKPSHCFNLSILYIMPICLLWHSSQVITCSLFGLAILIWTLSSLFDRNVQLSLQGLRSRGVDLWIVRQESTFFVLSRDGFSSWVFISLLA